MEWTAATVRTCRRAIAAGHLSRLSTIAIVYSIAGFAYYSFEGLYHILVEGGWESHKNCTSFEFNKNDDNKEETDLFRFFISERPQ